VSKLTAFWREWVSLSHDFRRKGLSLENIFLVSAKLDTFLLSDSANCTVLLAVVLTQYRRVTDGQTDRQIDERTDGIAIASTALAMRALWRAVIKLLWPPCVADADIIFLPCGFFLSSSIFLFFLA